MTTSPPTDTGRGWRDGPLFLGSPHPCGYLAARQARNAYFDPSVPLDAARYGELLRLGFRRGGPFVYRPHCLHCRQCVPLRVPVARFEPRRRHRRVLAANAGVVVEVGRRLRDDHFALYTRYLKARHPDDGMDPEDREAFHQFFECAWGDTRFWSLRDGPGGRLLALAAVDHTPGGLSAVYTCFEPNLPARSLGTLAILEQIAACRRQGVPYLYLGYWVPGSPKMDYKAAFRPAERLTPRGWEPMVSVEAQRVL